MPSMVSSVCLRDVEPRVSVSLRVPAAIAEVVNAYASGERVSKTDAYLHFLTAGIDRPAQSLNTSQADDILEQLKEVVSLLRSSCGDGGTFGDGEGLHAVDAREKTSAELQKVSQAVRDAALGFVAIERVYLFGSFARGDYDESSDVDIRLELADGERFNLRDLDQFAKRIERVTGRDVDVVSARRIANEALARAIERDKVLVYEREA